MELFFVCLFFVFLKVVSRLSDRGHTGAWFVLSLVVHRSGYHYVDCRFSMASVEDFVVLQKSFWILVLGNNC